LARRRRRSSRQPGWSTKNIDVMVGI
jgi:hypothetical protein